MRREEYAADRNRAAYYWEARRDGLVVAAEFLPDGKPSHASFATIARPFEIHARPYRMGDFRCFALSIQGGEEPIWEHFVIDGIRAGAGATADPYEGLLFGRRFTDGREELIVVLPSGNPVPCGSVAEARTAIAEGAALLREKGNPW